MKKIFVLLLIGSLALITACTDNSPKCSDASVTDLVQDIYKENISKVPFILIRHQMSEENLRFEINAIRTQDPDMNGGGCMCNADLKAIDTVNGNSVTIPISYTAELTDDRTQIYVTILKN